MLPILASGRREGQRQDFAQGGHRHVVGRAEEGEQPLAGLAAGRPAPTTNRIPIRCSRSVVTSVGAATDGPPSPDGGSSSNANTVPSRTAASAVG